MYSQFMMHGQKNIKLNKVFHCRPNKTCSHTTDPTTM